MKYRIKTREKKLNDGRSITEYSIQRKGFLFWHDVGLPVVYSSERAMELMDWYIDSEEAEEEQRFNGKDKDSKVELPAIPEHATDTGISDITYVDGDRKTPELKVRRCNVCGEYKELDCFIRDNRREDGRGFMCKKCRNDYEQERKRKKRMGRAADARQDDEKMV